MTRFAPVAALLLLAACAQPAGNNTADAVVDPEITEVMDESAAPLAGEGDAAAVADGAPPPVRDWTGTWVGVEGLALVIAPGATADTRKLTITLLDGTQDYVGTVADDAITFVRDGVTEKIRAGSGADTGLKYLDQKGNCLIIKPGEGFCR